MTQSINVLSLKAQPILQLLVSRPAAADQAAMLPGQTIVEGFHVTLARLDDLGITLQTLPELPPPPQALVLCDELRVVDTGVKRACYVELAAESQLVLRDFVRQCEELLNIRIFDPQRVFHVTLSNAGNGDYRASVGDVWAFPSQPT
jgi:hypothetical protein